MHCSPVGVGWGHSLVGVGLGSIPWWELVWQSECLREMAVQGVLHWVFTCWV